MDISRGDVWWWNCPIHSREHIQQGVRPVVVVSNDTCNQASPVVTVVPLTTAVKRAYPQQVPVIFNGSLSIAIADQITSIPVTELGKRICKLCDFQLDQIDTAVAIQLGIVSVKDRPYAPFPRKSEVE